MSRVSKENWPKIASKILKKELKREKITYNELCKRLAKIGVNETFGSISNKISRGSFSFIFFIQCIKAISSSRFRFDLTASEEDEKIRDSFLVELLLEQIKYLSNHEKEAFISLFTPQNVQKNEKRIKKKNNLSLLLNFLSTLK
jgi:hypothetical protein